MNTDNSHTAPSSDNTPKREIKTYSLADKNARSLLDLREYATLITTTVQSVIPNVLVTFTSDSYTVHGITNGEAIKI